MHDPSPLVKLKGLTPRLSYSTVGLDKLHGINVGGGAAWLTIKIATSELLVRIITIQIVTENKI